MRNITRVRWTEAEQATKLFRPPTVELNVKVTLVEYCEHLASPVKVRYAQPTHVEEAHQAFSRGVTVPALIAEIQRAGTRLKSLPCKVGKRVCITRQYFIDFARQPPE